MLKKTLKKGYIDERNKGALLMDTDHRRYQATHQSISIRIILVSVTELFQVFNGKNSLWY